MQAALDQNAAKEKKPGRKGVRMSDRIIKKPMTKEPTSTSLLAWYDRNARTLPWRISPSDRRKNVRADPYRIWLSEVMLQQTTVKAVIPYFDRFTDQWPDVIQLAQARSDEVMAAWAGLGYYSRARNLIACARYIADQLDGLFPTRPADLRQLPGIGQYTSAAIAAIAFDEPIAVVDGNVERVVTRLYAIDTPLPQAKRDVRSKLEPLVPQLRPGEFAEAMMDLGATVCTPRNPDCALCPLSNACSAKIINRQTEFPVRPPRKSKPTRFGHAFVAIRIDGAILLRRRPDKGLLGGMCEVPGSIWTTGSPPTDFPPPIAGEWSKQEAGIKHTFTHFHLMLDVHTIALPMSVKAPPDCWWSEPQKIKNEALPSLMVKVIEAALAAKKHR